MGAPWPGLTLGHPPCPRSSPFVGVTVPIPGRDSASFTEMHCFHSKGLIFSK